MGVNLVHTRVAFKIYGAFNSRLLWAVEDPTPTVPGTFYVLYEAGTDLSNCCYSTRYRTKQSAYGSLDSRRRSLSLRQRL